jgi:glucose dehydrogenase
MRIRTLCVVAAAVAPFACAATDWPSYGGDLANTRYAPLDQINAGNVSKLVKVWVFNTRPAEETGPSRPLKPRRSW